MARPQTKLEPMDPERLLKRCVWGKSGRRKDRHNCGEWVGEA